MLGSRCASYELVGAVLAALLYGLGRPEETGSGVFSSTPEVATEHVSEFIGIFVLVLSVGLCIITGFSAAA